MNPCRNNITLLIFKFILIIISNGVYCQKHYSIYLDDTTVLKNKTENPHSNLYFDFKDSLDDGSYILYCVHKKDSLKANKFVLLKCQYKNKLKEGIYERYYPSSHLIKNVCSYKSGKKNGIENEYIIDMDDSTFKRLIFHGEYSLGKKDGMFLYFDRRGGNIAQFRYYNNDSLKKIVRYGLFSDTIKFDEIEVVSRFEHVYTKYCYGLNIYKVKLIIQNGFLKSYYVYGYDGKIIIDNIINLDIKYSNPVLIPLGLLNISESTTFSSDGFVNYLKEFLKLQIYYDATVI